MRIARYGYGVVAAAWVLSLALAVAPALYRAFWLLPFAFLPGLFVTYFFRDPERKPPEGEHLLVAPADGRVMRVEETDECDFVGGRCWRISIFLSIFDVHINRSPARGRVGYLERRPGAYHNAIFEKAARENARCRLGLEDTPAGRLLVEQIAGIIARRIVCEAAPGDVLARGRCFGMIMFGSRTDLYLPKERVEVRVKPGDRVRAGETVVAEVKP